MRLQCFPALLLALSLLLFPSPSTAAETPDNLQQVTLQLRWSHQFQFAGYYAAVEKGFYRDAGLKVQIREGGFNTDPVEEVLAGNAQFGVTNSEVLLHYLNGDPVVALAAIFQHSPLAFLTRNRDIRSPQDFIGKKMKQLRATDVELRATLYREGVQAHQIDMVGGGYNKDDYSNASIDVLPVYTTNQPYFLKEKGLEYTIIYPATYGIDFYGDCLFTASSELEDHPDRIWAFLTASIRGWEYAMDHPEEMVDLILDKYSPKKSRTHLLFEAEAIRELMLPDLVQIGHMNPGRWRHIADTFARLGMAPQEYSLEDFIYDPERTADRTWLYWLLAITSAGIFIVGGVALFLMAFNRRLRREIKTRIKVQHSLKRSEERFRRLLERASDAFYLLDTDGNILEVNRAATEQLGYTRQELLGMNIDDIDVQVSDTERRNRWQQSLPEASYTLESSHRRKDGSLVPVEIRANVFIMDGTPHVIGLVRDISERKLAQEEKLLLEAQLMQAQKLEALGTLADGIAHDFNNLLQAISGYVHLLLERHDAPDPDHKYLTAIDDSITRASDLVTRMLTFSRRMDVKPELLDLNELLHRTLSFLKRTIPKMVEIKLHTDARLDMIHADPTQLEQVILNLAKNGVDAMDGHGTLTFRTAKITQESPLLLEQDGTLKGDHVLLEVNDTGRGMDAETLGRIYDPFFTTKEVGKGTGLGMAMVYGIVKLHKGRILCRSVPQEGTTFQILLPVNVSAAAEHKEGPRVEAAAKGGNETLLVIDDEPDIQEVAREALAAQGYHVYTASTGEEGLEILETAARDIDLILLDLGMPGMGGQKCLKKILAWRPEAKVVVASGYALHRIAKDPQKFGAAAFLAKPYKLNDLVLTIRRVLDQDAARPH